MAFYSFQLAFCGKEQNEWSTKFQEVKEQSCQLEKSYEHEPFCVSDSGDEDVVFVLPEGYSPLKKRKLNDVKKVEIFDEKDSQTEKDVAIAYFKPGTNLLACEQAHLIGKGGGAAIASRRSQREELTESLRNP